MKITLLGAAGEVTGSAYLLQTSKANVLIDFGMFQGGKALEELNFLPNQINTSNLDSVIVTHGHLDHTGRLPLLSKAGYRGTIYATKATLELSSLILRDSAKLQLADIQRTRRKGRALDIDSEREVYSLEDVDSVLGLFQVVDYHTEQQVADGVTAQFFEAGHILGSASVLVQADGKRILFSGDLGPLDSPILRDFETFTQADLVFMESTYGDRNHRTWESTVEEFLSILKKSVETKSRVIVPTFAVGRAQVILLLMAQFFREQQLPPFPVYLDSPMAVEATKILLKHPELYDEDFKKFREKGNLERDLKTLVVSQTSEDSKRINNSEGPCLILAGSGMCNGGRVLHHLRHGLSDPKTSVVFVGYQGVNTLGRQLVDRASEVKIFGSYLPVKATVHTLGGFSAHADQTDLLKWFSSLAKSKPKLVLTHGEDRARKILAQVIDKQFSIQAVLPKYGEIVSV
jgi:metallo-beta-lactamase family protein